MSKKDAKNKIEQQHACYICGKKPAFYQKGYMGGKYLCQTHAIHHLKYTRLMMKALVILVIAFAILYLTNSNADKNQQKRSEQSQIQTKSHHEKAAYVGID